MTQHVALLRGINVGGNNLIRMPDLKLCVEEGGFANVVTYIQSGNVLFEANEADAAVVEARITDALNARFGFQGLVVLYDQVAMQGVVAEAPEGFGGELGSYHYDVIFLKEPLQSDEALREVRTRQGVDRVWAGKRVCYFSRLISRAGQSYLSRVVGLPVYQRMTIRNWNTTTKLVALMDARAHN
jgi:uncharacterized protein (DUF1697 family)